jgi:hypothetical protein
MANLSIYDLRYGILPGEPYGPGKSGLTPLSPLHPAINLLSPEEKRERGSRSIRKNTMGICDRETLEFGLYHGERTENWEFHNFDTYAV